MYTVVMGSTIVNDRLHGCQLGEIKLCVNAVLFTLDCLKFVQQKSDILCQILYIMSTEICYDRTEQQCCNRHLHCSPLRLMSKNGLTYPQYVHISQIRLCCGPLWSFLGQKYLIIGQFPWAHPSP